MFDPLSYLMGSKAAGGGGVEVEALTVTQNKTYTAPEGKAYSPVTVNVPQGGALIQADYQGLGYAYLTTMGAYYWSSENNNYINFFPIKANKKYIIAVGETWSNRLRCAWYENKSFSFFEPYISTPNPSPNATEIYSIPRGISMSDSNPNIRLSVKMEYFTYSDGELVVVTSNERVIAPVYCIEDTLNET